MNDDSNAETNKAGNIPSILDDKTEQYFHPTKLGQYNKKIFQKIKRYFHFNLLKTNELIN